MLGRSDWEVEYLNFKRPCFVQMQGTCNGRCELTKTKHLIVSEKQYHLYFLQCESMAFSNHFDAALESPQFCAVHTGKFKMLNNI